MGESFETARPAGQHMLGRVPPNSIEAEEMLLSCCLMDNGDTLQKCITAKLNPYAFYSAANRLIYDTLRDMMADQKSIDVMILSEELRTNKQLDSVGGYGYITQVSGRAPTTAQATYFLEKVRELWQIREFIKYGTGLVESCYTYQGDLEGTFGPLVNNLNGILQAQEQSRSWNQAVEEGKALTQERMKPEEERRMEGRELSWGIADLDRYFGPLEPGELVVVGGYTSSGKSSLLRQILWSLARSGYAALIETIEVRDTEEAINLAGHISKIRPRARLDKLHPKDQEELLASFEKMKTPKFAVCHSDHNMAAMFARARAFKRKNGLAALGADYLQIMEDIKILQRNEREDMLIGRVTSGFKKFSTEENVVTFLLSGFNREYAKADNGREPRMTDLAGSSSIEKDASRVVLIHIPTEFTLGGQTLTQSLTADSADQPKFFVKLSQVKGRNQGTASVGMWFLRELKTFVAIAR